MPLTNNQREWIASIWLACPPADPTHACREEWIETDRIVEVLSMFLDLAHVMLPGVGGMDIKAVQQHKEGLAFNITDRSALVAKPNRLIFEWIEDSSSESFFLLELDSLHPAGVNETIDADSEEVVEIDGEYLPARVWDEGYLHRGPSGEKIPLPSRAKRLVRLFGGKLLFVARDSVWNRTGDTYDGRHNSMAAGDIRAWIERHI